MHVAVIYDPDPELPEPTDQSGQTHVRRSELIDADVVVIWREYGEQFTDGARTHVASSGVFANVTEVAIRDTVSRLLDL